MSGTGNNASCSLAAQKEVEGTPMEKAVNLLLVAAKKLDDNKRKEVHNVGVSGIDVRGHQSDEETKKCVDVLVDNSNKPGRSGKNKKEDVNKEPIDEAMKLLGSGQTPIKLSAYKKIKWESYTKATRQLLVELFPRTVLASHSLSGKQSPAFQDKAAKQSLDATIISDITETVCEKCQVKENLVRHVITIKCADEAKMLRQREKKAQKRPDNNLRPRVEEPEEQQNELSPQEKLRNKLRHVITIKCADEAKMLRQREKKAQKRPDNNLRPRVEEPEEQQNELSPQEKLRNKLRSVYLSAVLEKHKL